jgi:hypothetical protein
MPREVACGCDASRSPNSSGDSVSIELAKFKETSDWVVTGLIPSAGLAILETQVATDPWRPMWASATAGSAGAWRVCSPLSLERSSAECARSDQGLVIPMECGSLSISSVEPIDAGNEEAFRSGIAGATSSRSCQAMAVFSLILFLLLFLCHPDTDRWDCVRKGKMRGR